MVNLLRHFSKKTEKLSKDSPCLSMGSLILAIILISFKLNLFAGVL